MESPETSPAALPIGREVEELLDLHGIQGSYINYAGEELQISHSNRLTVLGLMGVKLTPSTDVSAVLASCQETSWGHWLPPATVVSAGSETTLALRVPLIELESPVNWQLTTEAGEQFAGSFEPRQLPETDHYQEQSGPASVRQLSLPPLPAGYHKLNLEHSGHGREFRLIAAPDRCYVPHWAETGQKLAGISLHLYELCSDRNWGIGDFLRLAGFHPSRSRQRS